MHSNRLYFFKVTTYLQVNYTFDEILHTTQGPLDSHFVHVSEVMVRLLIMSSEHVEKHGEICILL